MTMESLNLYDEGLEVCFFDKEALLQAETTWDGRPLPDWFTNLANHFGERVRDLGGTEGVLIGASYTDVDYYYIILDTEGNRHFSSCVGKIEFLKTKTEEPS